MKDSQVDQLVTWITEAGLAGLGESAILTGVCERLLACGAPLARANIVIDTLHPVYQGRAFTWKREKMATMLSEFGRSNEGEDPGNAAHSTILNSLVNNYSGDD